MQKKTKENTCKCVYVTVRVNSHAHTLQYTHLNRHRETTILSLANITSLFCFVLLSFIPLSSDIPTYVLNVTTTTNS